MPFSRLLKKFGAWTTLLSWNEPLFYRSRLRRDLGTRLAIAFGCGALATSILLALFTFNARPLQAIHSLWGMVFLGGLAAMFLLRGKSSAGGRVRICEEGIIRSRQYVGIGSQWVEDASWCYDVVRACAIVEGSSIGHGFSLLLVGTDQNLDLIGIPASKDLQQITALLNGRGVQVQISQELPGSLRKPMPLLAGIFAVALGCMTLMMALVLFALVTWSGGHGGRRDLAVPNERPARPEALPPGLANPAWQPGVPGSPLPPSAESNGAQPDAAWPVDPTRLPGGNPALVPQLPRPSFPELPERPTLPERPPLPDAVPSEVTAPGRVPPSPATAPKRPASKAPAAGTPTELVGGSQGVAFTHAVPEGATVVGFRFLLTRWKNRPALAQLYPLDSRGTGGLRTTVVAKEGYAVGGMQVVAGERVEAIRIVFVRQTESGLDKSDFYFSDWIGEPGESVPTTLGSGTIPVVGVCGRRGAMIEALGLLLQKEE